MSDIKLSRADPGYWIEKDFGVCDACGLRSHFRYEKVINDLLASEWQMDAEQKTTMSRRESMHCLFCGSSYRLRLLARAIQFAVVGDAKEGLERRIEEGYFNDIDVAEINSCGVLHDILQRMHSDGWPSDIPRAPY